MIRIALAAIALLLFAPVAQAASFDCTKASTSFEKAICSDDATSEQDEILAQAYATAIGGLSTEAANEIKATQKAWLGYAQHACSDDATVITGDYTDDQKQCLASTFRSRVSALEASRMQGGYRFYPIDRYLVTPDTEMQPGDYGYKAAEKEYHIVKIDRDDALAAAFNAMIDALIAEEGDFFRPGTTEISDDVSTSDDDRSARVDEVTNHRITLTASEWFFGHGTAHGSYFITHIHFLTEQKRQLEAADIFEAAGWEDRLAEIATAKLKEQLDAEDLFPDFEKDVKAPAIDPRRWMFSDAGLGIQFNIYEVTPYAVGAPVITIPWDELSGLLAEGAEEIAYY